MQLSRSSQYLTSLMLCREDEHLLLLEQDLRAVLLKISTSDAVLTTLPSGIVGTAKLSDSILSLRIASLATVC